MTPPDLTQALTSTVQLIEARDTLRRLHGDAKYEAKIERYKDIIGEVQAHTGTTALDTAIDIAKDAVNGNLPSMAWWLLAAACELEGAP